MNSISASTSSTATGSLRPDSPSSARASRRRRVELRSSAKIAAPSVLASTAPTIRPCSRSKPNSSAAVTPAIAAVIGVATSASEIAVPSTGRISTRPEVRPPSNRISASATIPIVRASS